MNKKNKKILSIYRHYLILDRGTPIRVKSLIKEMSKVEDFEIHTASQDEDGVISDRHLNLSRDNFKNIIEINRYIKNNEIDVVIFHSMSAAYYLIPLFFLRRGYKKVLEMHGFIEEESKLYNDISYIKYYRNKFIYSVIYRMCDLITTCSETARERILNFNKNTHTVFGGVDLDKFNSSNLTKNQKPKTKNQLIIGYSGNGRLWQGLSFLIESFSILVERDPSFYLRLLLSEKVNLPNIKNVEVFKPVRHEEVANFNAGCDVLVIPRENNVVNTLSFPSKLMEYLAMGVPVLCSKTSDMHKIVSHKETGLLYEPGNKEEFIKCLMLLKDPVLRKRMSTNGELMVRSKYSWVIQGKLFANLVKNIK